MKTIKFTLFALIALLVAVLSLKYTVVSLQYITTDFITTDSKELVNFGLTFAIQAIVLAGLSGITLSIFVACIQLAIKYYHISAKVRRDKALINHIEDERYNELVNKLRNTKTIDLKREYIDEYLNYDKNKAINNIKLHEILNRLLKDRNKAQITKEEPLTSKEASIIYEKEPIKSDLFPKDGIDFIPVDRNIHKE